MKSNTERNITISVILPVYHVKPWIGECIRSLKQQRLEGLEFIVVDDCGSDNSMAAVEKWAEQDSRVRILRNEKNMGPGPSRNRGIDAARGEYLSFIDPDDWVSGDFYELLYAKAKETGCDIVKALRVSVTESGSHDISPETHGADGYNKKIWERNDLPLYCCFRTGHHSAIYKSSLFLDGEVRYGETRVGEDSTFLLKVCSRTESIITVDRAVYYYRLREGAATGSYSFKRSEAQLSSLEERIGFLKTTNPPDHLDHLVYYYKNVFHYYLTCYYYAIKEDRVPEADNAAFIQKIRTAVLNTGVSSALLQALPELDVLLRFGYAIPPDGRRGSEADLTPLTEWTGFFTDCRGALKKEYYQRYAIVFLRLIALSVRLRSSDPAAAKTLAGASLDLLHRLNAADRAKVLLYLPSSLAASIIGRLR